MERLVMEKLPAILTADEIINKAFKKAAAAAAKVSGPHRVVVIQREHKRIVIMSSSVVDQLSKFVSGFPSLANLPPFYRDLVEAIFSTDSLRRTLGAVDGTAKVVDKLKREHLNKLRYARSTKESAAVRRQAYGRVASVLKKSNEDLLFLRSVAEKLSDLPKVYVDMPTVVIAGYPNVGKTTLLKALTGSSPKIASYPFTTTGLQLGYFEHSHQRYQVVDTPGLLDRPLEKRNPIERQAISALRHLAKVIVFMLDPSESCGYELKDQLHLLGDTEKMFEGIKMLIVVNKTDLLDAEKVRQVREWRPSALLLTASTGQGVEELREKLL